MLDIGSLSILLHVDFGFRPAQRVELENVAPTRTTRFGIATSGVERERSRLGSAERSSCLGAVS